MSDAIHFWRGNVVSRLPFSFSGSVLPDLNYLNFEFLNPINYWLFFFCRLCQIDVNFDFLPFSFSFLSRLWFGSADLQAGPPRRLRVFSALSQPRLFWLVLQLLLLPVLLRSPIWASFSFSLDTFFIGFRCSFPMGNLGNTFPAFPSLVFLYWEHHRYLRNRSYVGPKAGSDFQHSHQPIRPRESVGDFA